MTRVVSDFDVSIGGLEVLAMLLRSGEPYRLTPTELSDELLLSSGAMTHRLDRLEKQGLVKRRANPDDRRGYQITLTKQGLSMVEDALSAQYEEGRRLLSVLKQSDERGLVSTLRKLQSSLNEEDTRISRQGNSAKNRVLSKNSKNLNS